MSATSEMIEAELIETAPATRPEAETDDAREFAAAVDDARALIANGQDKEALALAAQWPALKGWAQSLIAKRERDRQAAPTFAEVPSPAPAGIRRRLGTAAKPFPEALEAAIEQTKSERAEPEPATEAEPAALPKPKAARFEEVLEEATAAEDRERKLWRVAKALAFLGPKGFDGRNANHGGGQSGGV